MGNGSPWISPAQSGYIGNQVAGIDGTGSISQTFVVTNGPNIYTISWLAAGSEVSGDQSYTVQLLNDSTGQGGHVTYSTTSGSNFIAEQFTDPLSDGTSLPSPFGKWSQR